MRFFYTKTFSRAFAIFVIIALVIILDARGYLGVAKNGYLRVYGNITNSLGRGTDSVKNLFQTIFTIKNLARENAVLSQKIDELSFENARLQSAKEENAALRRSLSFQEQSLNNLLGVEVLSMDPTGFSQSVVINKGYNAQIKPGQPVVVAPGLLVGKIAKVYQSTAEVILITDPSVVVNGEVAESSAKGLVKGEHGLGLIFGLVTQNELIKTGDQVITSGLSNDYPRGLLVGEITSIRSSSSELFQKAYVSPAADLRNLRFLFVIQN
jgi:rod shape-determining protein MreC